MPLAYRLVPAVIALEIAVLAVWWHPALVPLGLLAAAAPWWRRSGRGLSQWLAIRSAWRRRRALGWDQGGPATVLGRVEVRAERDAADEQVAVLEDEIGAVAVLAIDPAALVSRGAADGPEPASGADASAGAADPAWPVIARLLADAVRPAAVQVVRTEYGSAWLALRVEPGGSGDAASRRGGGAQGRRRAVIAVASRAVALLGDVGLNATVLKPQEAEAVLAAVAQGPGLPGASEAWRGWQGPEGAVRYWMFDRPVESWVSVTLVPASGSGARFRAKAGAAACRVLQVGDSVPGAVPLDGQHGLALLAAAPLAWDAAVLGPAGAVDSGSLPGFGSVARSTGLRLGLDAEGRTVRARLHRAAPTGVALVGGPQIGRMLIERAPGRAVVVTARPDAWSGLPPTATVVGPATAFACPGGPTAPGLVLWDRIVPAQRPAWCAVVTLVEDLTPASAAPLRTADLVLAHRLDEERAKVFAAALGLSARQAHWLARGPEDGLAIVEGCELTFLALGG